MGPPDRFDWYLSRFFGFAIGHHRFPYEHYVVVMLPFVTVCIGLGRDYLDPDFRGHDC